MAKHRSRSREGALELSLLLSTTILSLFIAGLALVGIRFFSGAQSSSCTACDSMTSGSPERTACYAACTTGGSSYSAPSSGYMGGGGYMDPAACLSGCNSMTCGTSSSPTYGGGMTCEQMKENCVQGCNSMGGGSSGGASSASCILWKSDLYSSTAGKIVGSEECDQTGKCTRKDLSGNTVSVCGGSSGAYPSTSSSGGGTSGMSGCTYPNAYWSPSNTMGKTAYATVTVTCTDSDTTAGDCRTAGDNVHLGANARNQVSLGAPSTCTSWGGGGSSTGGGGSMGCMPGVPGYPDAYSRTPTCASYGSAGGTNGGTTGTVSGQQSSKKEDDPLTKFREEIDALDFTTMPCLHPLLSITPNAETLAWRQDSENLELYTWLVSGAGWLHRVQAHGVLTMSEMLALPVCREEDKIVTEEQSADCRDVEEDCRHRTQAVYLLEGEEIFLERVQTCMNNHPASDECLFSGNFEGLAKKEVGGTCVTDAECPGGWRCDTENYHERSPRSRATFGATVLENTFLGRCISGGDPEIPEGMCAVNEDCQEGLICQPTTCGTAPCYGVCTEPEEEEEVSEEDLCGPSLAGARERLGEGASPAEVVKFHAELLAQGRTTLEEYEACRSGQTEGSEEEEETEVHGAAPEDVAYTFSRAVGLFITILHHAAELPEDFIKLVRSATEQFGTWLQDIAGGKEIDLGAAMQLAQSVRDRAPEELRDLVGEERREEWRESAIGDIRMMNQEMDATLDWVGRLLDALEKYGYEEAKITAWRAVLGRAQEMFYKEGGVRDQCLAFISVAMPAPGQELTCDVGEVFSELEKTMKRELESCKMMFEGGDAMPSAACSIVGQAMADPTVGPPPMEDHGGPGGQGGSCENRCGGGNIERIFQATDAMPEAAECLAEDDAGEQSAECEGVMDALDRENARTLFGAQGEMFLDAFHSCMSTCEGSQGGGNWRQEKGEMEERCFEASNQAALTICSMHPGTQRVGMGEVDDMLYSMGAEMCIQIHPSYLKVAGVDFDCPESSASGMENCDQYWKDAEGKCKVNWQMDHACFRTEVGSFPEQCRPGPNDPIWKTADQWTPTGPGGGGMSSMQNCTYLNASKNGQPLGEVFCERDYFNCKKKSTGEPIENMGLSLGAPSHCESGWMSVGGSDMICYEANWNNTSGKAYLRCPRSGGSCDDGGMARSLTDPRYSNVREVSCSSLGGGYTGGGGTGASGCFYTAAQKNGQYIGYTVHTNTDSTNPRYGDPNGAPVDMTGVSLGTQKNCYGPANTGGGGTAGGGGSMGGSYPWGCSFGGTTMLQNGTQLTSAMCPLESQASNTCTGSSGQGSVSFQPGDVLSWGTTNACAGGYMGGGSTGGYGTYSAMGECTFATANLRDGSSATGVRCPQYSGPCTGWKGSQSVTIPREDITTGWANASCSGGGQGGTYGSCPSSSWSTVTWQRSGGTETTCVGPNVTQVEIDAAKAAIAQNCPSTTWFTYGNPTDASRPGAGVPSCPSGGGSYSSSSSPSGGATGTPQAGCSYSYGTLTNGTSVTYASCPLETPNMCNTSAGTVSYNDLRVPAPSACASGGQSSSASSAPSNCPSNKWYFPSAQKADGSTVAVTCEMNGCKDASGAYIGDQITNWGPSSCVSASGNGILHTMGNFIRMVVGGTF